MKKVYQKPVVINFDLENPAIPSALGVGAALVGGYAVGRAVHNMMKAAPVIKMKGMNI